jgi:hypothetical protein
MRAFAHLGDTGIGQSVVKEGPTSEGPLAEAGAWSTDRIGDATAIPIAWRRRTLRRDELTPVGRLLFAGNGMRMRGWRLAPSLAVVAANGLATLFLLGASALALAATWISRSAPGALAGAVPTAAFFVAALALYARALVGTAANAWLTGTWPAPRPLAWRSGAWIDAVREPGDRPGRLPRIARQVVEWSAECPACGGPVHLVERDGDRSGSPGSVCATHPLAHRCTFDRTTLSGECTVVRNARTGRPELDEDWMDHDV